MSATVPITLGVNLQVSINGFGDIQVVTPTVRVAVPQINALQVDDLGIPFSIVMDESTSEQVSIVSWTAFAGDSDYFEADGEIALTDNAKAFKQVLLTMKMYDRRGDLIDTSETRVSDYELEGTGSATFQFSPSTDVDDIKRYAVEVVVKG